MDNPGDEDFNSKNLDGVLRLLEQAREFGCRELASGAKLYGHIPHIAPEAWFHQVYHPLSASDVASLGERIGIPISGELRRFFQTANGLGMFAYSLAIFGKRTSYGRRGDEAWQPFCVVTANTLERPRHARPTQVVVGSYRSDGSLLLLDTLDETVTRTKEKSKTILNSWPNLSSMLNQEALRLSELFDSRGRRLGDGPTTPTPFS